MIDYWQKFKEDYQKKKAAQQPTVPAPMQDDDDTPPAVDPSQFEVNVSDDTVKMNGRPDSLPSGLDGLKTTPVGEPDVQMPAVQQNPKDAPTKVSAAPSAPSSTGPAKDETMKGFTATGSDNDARRQMLESTRKERLLSMIPEAIGGIGDAIAQGNQAYGVKGPTDTQDSIHKGTLADIDQKKGQFEENLKNDPNSDISKQYQTSAAKAFQMMGTKVDPANLAKMSAAQLEAQMPNIEKIAKMQNDKDMKTIQLQANQLKQKDLENQRQNMMYVRMSTSLGGDKELNDLKTRKDNIERAYPALKMAKTPQELAEAGIATLRVINPNGVVGHEMLDRYIPKGIGQDAAQIAQWITNNPQDAHVQAYLNRYKMLLDRETGVVNDQYTRAFNRKMAGLKPIMDQNPDVAGQLYQDWGVQHPQFNPAPKAAPQVGTNMPKAGGPANDPLGLR